MMNDNPEYEVYRAIWEITERKDGCVFKTKFLHKAWVPMGQHGDGANLIYASISTTDPDAHNLNIRRKKN
jgi:hypothetical protein